jgi:hypothetical protein
MMDVMNSVASRNFDFGVENTVSLKRKYFLLYHKEMLICGVIKEELK